ncbi:MAG TPA: sigma-70 family RNA polymerase sigma factor [Acidimicrobiales bacterium]
MVLRSREVDLGDQEPDDIELARRAGKGDSEAFEVLYRRHAAAAWRVAQAVTPSKEDASDAVSEAFTRVLQALAMGQLSPSVPFRPYLLATTRNAAIDEHRYRSRVGRDPGVASAERPSSEGEPGEQTILRTDTALVAEAFHSLPERWRSVLWLTEVEGVRVRDVGERMGISANGASQLAHRARTGLRERYLQAHIRHGVPAACARTVSQLGAYAAGALGARATAQVDQHLAACPSCRERAAELRDIGSSLRTIALPIPAGLAAASFTKWRSAFHTAGTREGTGLRGWGRAGVDRATRSLAVTTTVLLALGVITAGLMSNGRTPPAVPAGRVGGSVASAPPAVAQLAGSGQPVVPSATGSGPAPGSGPGGSASPTNGPDGGASPGGGDTPTPAATPPGASGVPGPDGGEPAGGGGGGSGPGGGAGGPGGGAGAPGGGGALVQVALGANVGVTTASAAVGIGGGCTGISVNQSPSCAPTAPAGPGVHAVVTTPLGPIDIATPQPAAATTAAPRVPAPATPLIVRVASVDLSL